MSLTKCLRFSRQKRNEKHTPATWLFHRVNAARQCLRTCSRKTFQKRNHVTWIIYISPKAKSSLMKKKITLHTCTTRVYVFMDKHSPPVSSTLIRATCASKASHARMSFYTWQYIPILKNEQKKKKNPYPNNCFLFPKLIIIRRRSGVNGNRQRVLFLFTDRETRILFCLFEFIVKVLKYYSRVRT